jgi:hypothetical protein
VDDSTEKILEVKYYSHPLSNVRKSRNSSSITRLRGFRNGPMVVVHREKRRLRHHSTIEDARICYRQVYTGDKIARLMYLGAASEVTILTKCFGLYFSWILILATLIDC